MIRELVLIFFIVFGGIFASQAPQFVQEYEQRLGGALDEATFHLSGYKEVARQNNLSFEQYIRILIENPDENASDTGRIIGQLAERAETLKRQLDAISLAPHLTRPIAVLQNSDPEIFSATFDNYKLSLTLDVTFGVIGLILGYMVHKFLWLLVTITFTPRRPKYARR